MQNWDAQLDTSELSWNEYVTRGTAHLRSDPVMAGLVAATDPPSQRSSNDIYIDLIDAIVSQQLSVKAAASIMNRFLALFPEGKPEPAAVLGMSEDELRAVGLSRPKVRYLHGIADAIINDEIDLTAIAGYQDEDFIEAITALKGVGRWTAEMLLIFSLGRRDVFSVGDLGLRNAVARAYGVERDDHEAIEAIAERWRPYRSLACHFLWKSLDNEPKIG
jgi:DNA-3-methyladenine glycosylase II